MIDIHCHILPGIDDGAASFTDSIAMANAAVEQGIDTIIATPHHRNGKYNNVKSDILAYTEELNTMLQRENIPLTILPGQETRLNGDMLTDLEQDELLTLNHTRYLFVEFPFDHMPRYAKRMLFDLQVAGYTPVIVHPERNRDILEHPSILYDLVHKGALTQVTAGSLTGEFGKKIQKYTNQLIEANLAHFIASDAHNTTTRGFRLQQAYAAVEAQYGQTKLNYFRENSELIINGSWVWKDEPFEVKKRKFLGLF